MKRTLERVVGGAVVIGGTALKWGFVFAKFFGFFISAAADLTASSAPDTLGMYRK